MVLSNNLEQIFTGILHMTYFQTNVEMSAVSVKIMHWCLSKALLIMRILFQVCHTAVMMHFTGLYEPQYTQRFMNKG